MAMKLSAAQNLGKGLGGGIGAIIQAIRKKNEEEDRLKKIAQIKSSFSGDPALQGDPAFQALDLLGKDITPEDYYKTAFSIRSANTATQKAEAQRTEDQWKNVQLPDGSVVAMPFSYQGKPLQGEPLPVSGPKEEYGTSTLGLILQKNPGMSIEDAIALLSKYRKETSSSGGGMTDAQKRSIAGQISAAEGSLAAEYAKLQRIQAALDAKEVEEGILINGKRVTGGDPNHVTDPKTGEITKEDTTPRTDEAQELRRTTARAQKEAVRQEISRIRARIGQLKSFLQFGYVPAQEGGDDFIIEQLGQ